MHLPKYNLVARAINIKPTGYEPKQSRWKKDKHNIILVRFHSGSASLSPLGFGGMCLVTSRRMAGASHPTTVATATPPLLIDVTIAHGDANSRRKGRDGEGDRHTLR